LLSSQPQRGNRGSLKIQMFGEAFRLFINRMNENGARTHDIRRPSDSGKGCCEIRDQW